MRIRISRHARARMSERGVSEDEVIATLTNPLDIVRGRYGRELFTRHFGPCDYVVVVAERTDEDLIVVTVLRVDRERALRYGFIRV